MKTLQESIFDTNLANKNLSPTDIAGVLHKNDIYSSLNYDDGSKDVLGQPLKEGDIIIVFDNPMILGSYIGKKGRLVEFRAVPRVLIEDPSDPQWHQRLACYKVIKVDKKLL